MSSFLTLFATCKYEFLISLYLRLNQFSVLVTDMPVPVTAEYFMVSFLNNKGLVTTVKFLVHVAETICFEQTLKICVEVVILRLYEFFQFFQKFTEFLYLVCLQNNIKLSNQLILCKVLVFSAAVFLSPTVMSKLLKSVKSYLIG